MRILISGICGFVGSRIARRLRQQISGIEITGIDNLLRPGSELNRPELRKLGIRLQHGDVRMRSDFEALGPADWVIDAAANPSVLAGVDGRSSPRQLSEHNLLGTLNILEYCREHRAGFLLLSTSRVYSVRALASIPVREFENRFVLDIGSELPPGLSPKGASETFPVSQPISLYGATKLASEVMALEYGFTFDFPVWINRCGVLAGAGQFGTAEQGIFSYWMHAHATGRPLRYIGFGGRGLQVRDALHPDDLTDLLISQMKRDPFPDPVFNVAGGIANAMSLAELTQWCDARFRKGDITSDDRPRPFDAPWLVLDSSRIESSLDWRPQRSLESILEEIEAHVRANPDWLERCAAV